MCPMAYAMVNTVRPNARETPNKPIPTFGNAAASTALPHPPNTSQNVPRNSAVAFLPRDIDAFLLAALMPPTTCGFILTGPKSLDSADQPSQPCHRATL